jgi:hypothetical protein
MSIQYAVAPLPAVHWKVTPDPLNVEPGVGVFNTPSVVEMLND